MAPVLCLPLPLPLLGPGWIGGRFNPFMDGGRAEGGNLLPGVRERRVPVPLWSYLKPTDVGGPLGYAETMAVLARPKGKSLPGAVSY